MAEAIETLFIELRGSIGKLQQDMGSAVGVISDTNKKITGIANKISTAVKIGFAGVGLVAVNKFKDALFDLANKGEDAGSIAQAFEKLGGQAASIQAAQKATLGLVSSFDLMKAANQGLLAGLPSLNQNFAQIADVAARSADALGIDTKQAIDDLTNALISGKTKALEKFGFDLEGVTGKANIQAAAMSQLAAVQARLGPVTDSVANANQALGVLWDDTITKIGIQINESPAFIEALRGIGETVKSIDFSILIAALLEFTNLTIKGIGLVVDFAKFLGTGLADGVALAKVKFAEFNVFWTKFWQDFDTGVGVIKKAWEDFWQDFNKGVDVLKSGIDKTTGFFKDMYDQVVGNSYIPDMMDEIDNQFQRLQYEMVDPVTDANIQVQDSFVNMTSNVNKNISGLVSNIASAFGVDGALGDILGNLAGALFGGSSGGDVVTAGLDGLGAMIGLPPGTVSGVLNAVGLGGFLGDIGGAVDNIMGGFGDVFGSVGGFFGFAKGGIIKSPTSLLANGGGGVMGESGPEAIMPLTSIGGRLGVRAIGSGGAKVVYNIDARGAAAGVEHQIMRALRDVEDRAVARAVNLVADSRRRGGAFGDAI